jgi:hypothetical protein
VIESTTDRWECIRTFNLNNMKMILGTIGSATCLAAVLALTASTTQAQNLLVDPGFESGVAGQPNPIPLPGVITVGNPTGALNGVGGGWTVFNGAAYSTAHPKTGTWGIQEVQGIGQAWNFEAPYQVVGGVIPGRQYTLSADYMTTTGNSQTPGGYIPVVLQMTFFSVTGADLGTVETSPGNARAVQNNMGALNTWFTGTVTATAPAGAIYVAPYLAFMENGSQTAADTLFWDNAVLTASVVPEPGSLALLGLGLVSTLIWRRRQ